jgi:hypothetical protein
MQVLEDNKIGPVLPEPCIDDQLFFFFFFFGQCLNMEKMKTGKHDSQGSVYQSNS